MAENFTNPLQLVAERLLERVERIDKFKPDKTKLVGFEITDEQFPELEDPLRRGIAEPLARLENRKIITFENRDMFEPFYTDWSPDGEPTYQIKAEADKLRAFIATTRAADYDLTKQDRMMLIAAYGLIRVLLEDEKHQVTGYKIRDMWSKADEAASWLEDYSGLVHLSREIKPVVIYESNRYEAENLTPEITTAYLRKDITDQAEALMTRLRDTLHETYRDRLTDKLPIRWACIPNKHFIDELDFEKLAQQQDNHFVGKYRACRKCRSKNTLFINLEGHVEFQAEVKQDPRLPRKKQTVDTA